jgi:hypothetical protein
MQPSFEYAGRCKSSNKKVSFLILMNLEGRLEGELLMKKV